MKGPKKKQMTVDFRKTDRWDGRRIPKGKIVLRVVVRLQLLKKQVFYLPGADGWNKLSVLSLYEDHN